MADEVVSGLTAAKAEAGSMDEPASREKTRRRRVILSATR